MDQENVPSYLMPSFVRLFVIRRTLLVAFEANNDNVDQITQLVAIPVFQNDKDREMSQTILTRLLTDGIKKYMRIWYDEQKQANLIETIFNKIILKTYEKEYEKVTKYVGNENYSDKYQNIVFNTSDLMCYIFQYLSLGWNFDEDLVTCGLVNSNWLIHAYNPNSIGLVNLDGIVDRQLDQYPYWPRSNKKGKQVFITKWQRLINAKRVSFCSGMGNYMYPTQELLNRISLFNKIEVLQCNVRQERFIPIIRLLMSTSQDKIRECNVQLHAKTASVLPPVKLMTARFIEIHFTYFPIIWSNKCNTLKLMFEVRWKFQADSAINIDDNWCNCVIDNCDCSGIESLCLDHVGFDITNSKTLIGILAVKFINLKRLTIVEPSNIDSCLLLFLKYLKPIIDKNDTIIDFQQSVDYFSRANSINQLTQVIKDYDIPITSFYYVTQTTDTNFAFKDELLSLQIILRCKKLKQLRIKCFGDSDKFKMLVEALKHKNLRYESLMALKFESG